MRLQCWKDLFALCSAHQFPFVLMYFLIRANLGDEEYSLFYTGKFAQFPIYKNNLKKFGLKTYTKCSNLFCLSSSSLSCFLYFLFPPETTPSIFVSCARYCA